MIEDHQLVNLATIHWMRDWLDALWSPGHPLELRNQEGGGLLLDRSTPRFTVPLSPARLPHTELGKILGPLAQICARYKGLVPEGWWEYRWFYYELLDHDRRFRPLCWISPRLLHAGLDSEALRDGQWHEYGLPGETHLRHLLGEAGESFIAEWCRNDQVAGIEAGLRECRLALEEHLRAHSHDPSRQSELDSFVEHWRRHERLWCSKGLLSYDMVPSWCSMLRFEPKAAQEEAEALRTTGYLRRPFATEPLSLENAWYPGLRWNMIPLYDGRYPDEVPLAMRDDLFRTSYFSPTAGARTDAGLWQHFESRYGLGFQRTSQRAFRALARRARIAELRRDGRTIPEIAGALLDEGLHPLDEKEAHAARQTTGVPRQKLEISAAETVHAILKSLRKDKKAKVPALRPGRPRKNTKDGPQADERPTASGLDV